jgi:rhodanese-related sulfurtransferase
MLKTIPQLISAIRPGIHCISALEANSEINENSGLLIDVREPAEVTQQATTRSINIPRGVLEMKMIELYPNPETPIYIHCATGARATLSAEQLIRIGYSKVSIITCDLETICKVI